MHLGRSRTLIRQQHWENKRWQRSQRRSPRPGSAARRKEVAGASSSVDRTKLPLPESTFRGTIGKTYLESKSDWPQVPTPAGGEPNVVVILFYDDVGFGQVSTFGGPVPTPELDKPAAEGLRYNRFDSTAICGPSRAPR